MFCFKIMKTTLVLSAITILARALAGFPVGSSAQTSAPPAVAIEDPDPGKQTPPVASTAQPGDFESHGEADVSKSFSVMPGGKLDLAVDRGSVRVGTSDDPAVKVRVRREVTNASDAAADRILKEHKVLMKQSGNTISVSTSAPQNLLRGSLWRGHPGLNVRYEITVPHKFDVQLRTEGGSIRVTDLDGKLDAATEGGSLHFAGIQGPVTGKTEGGNVSAEACHGLVDLKTEGGSISVKDFHGPALQAKTEGGSVTADFAVAPQSDCHLSTEGGNVTARLPADAGVMLEAHTEGGSTSSDLPVTVQGKVHHDTLRGPVNGGGPKLVLKTEGGNIRVLKH